MLSERKPGSERPFAIMNEYNDQIDRILSVFDQAGFLNDVILIGSWCLVFYQQIFEGFSPLVRTTDIDFYVPDVKKPSSDCNLISALREINYDHISDTLTNKSKFISPDGFEIEFLTKLYRQGESTITIGKTGINAESLSYVELFSQHYMEVKRNGLSLKIASPSAFVLQKLLINDRRGLKAEKDLQAIQYVLGFLVLSKKQTADFLSIWNNLPKKWKAKILKVSKNKGFNLPEEMGK